MSRIERIADDIFVLSDLIPIDGRISWVPARAKGFEPHNSYVLLSEDRALLIDTGVASREESLLESLRELIGSRQLVVYITRIELDCLGNLGRLLDLFPGTQVTTSNVVPLLGLIHVSEAKPAPRLPRRILMGNTLAEAGFPRLKIYEAVIRTLGSTFLWDEKTKTLFTTDIFNTDIMENERQSVLRRDEAGIQDPQTMREFILCKFDWLAAADTRKLAAAWDKLFSEVRPSVIAPIHGRVQVGRNVVEKTIENYRKAVFALQTAS